MGYAKKQLLLKFQKVVCEYLGSQRKPVCLTLWGHWMQRFKKSFSFFVFVLGKKSVLNVS